MRSGRQTRQYFRNLSNLTEARHILHAISVEDSIRESYKSMTNSFDVGELVTAIPDYSRPRQNMLWCQESAQLGRRVGQSRSCGIRQSITVNTSRSAQSTPLNIQNYWQHSNLIKDNYRNNE